MTSVELSLNSRSPFHVTFLLFLFTNKISFEDKLSIDICLLVLFSITTSIVTTNGPWVLVPGTDRSVY